MNDPIRLLEGGSSEERRLIAWGRADEPPTGAVARALSTLGVASAVALAPLAAHAAVAASGGAASGSVAGSAASASTLFRAFLARQMARARSARRNAHDGGRNGSDVRLPLALGATDRTDRFDSSGLRRRSKNGQRSPSNRLRSQNSKCLRRRLAPRALLPHAIPLPKSSPSSNEREALSREVVFNEARVALGLHRRKIRLGCAFRRSGTSADRGRSVARRARARRTSGAGFSRSPPNEPSRATRSCAPQSRAA